VWKTSGVNLVLRSLTLVSKFILLIFIARYLSPEDLGVFCLMTVTITTALYLLGMDFHVYNTREILARGSGSVPILIRDQLVFHAGVYILALPALLAVFLGGILEWRYVGWFYALLVLEHLSQESYRILVTLSRSPLANAVLFLRSGAWVYAVIALGLAGPQYHRLSSIWVGWLFGVVSSLILTALVLCRLPWRENLSAAVDWKWIRRGTSVCLPFLTATMAMLLAQYVDRYFIKLYHGDAMVGVYTFYAGIANVLRVLAFTAVTVIYYPKIIATFQSSQFSGYRQLMTQFGRKLAMVAGAMLVILATAIDPILSITGKQLFREHLAIYWILLTSATVLTFSEIPHYALYARRLDRALVGSGFIALAVSLAANALLTGPLGIKGAAIASCAAMCALLVAKVIALKVSTTGERARHEPFDIRHKERTVDEDVKT
jgi:O-antigen/teichoic acid export membrane protein